jgi:hypothetical protein
VHRRAETDEPLPTRINDLLSSRQLPGYLSEPEHAAPWAFKFRVWHSINAANVVPDCHMPSRPRQPRINQSQSNADLNQTQSLASLPNGAS